MAGEGTWWHSTPGGRHCRGNALVQDGRFLRAPNKNKIKGCLQEPAEYHPPVFLWGSNPQPRCMPAVNGSRTCSKCDRDRPMLRQLLKVRRYPRWFVASEFDR